MDGLVTPMCTQLHPKTKACSKSRLNPPNVGQGDGITARSGAPGGTRTHNLLIRSQTLCPLSYGGITLDYTAPAGLGKGKTL